MFKQFYEIYINSEIMQKKDLTTLIEVMAQTNLLGPEILRKSIFPLMGTQKEQFPEPAKDKKGELLN